jgi:hypothetical protein
MRSKFRHGIEHGISVFAQVTCVSIAQVRDMGTEHIPIVRLARPALRGQADESPAHFARTLGAKPYGWEYPHGDSYARLQLRGALHVNSVQTYEAAGVAGLGLIQASLLAIGRYFEWSVDRASTRFSAQVSK